MDYGVTENNRLDTAATLVSDLDEVGDKASARYIRYAGYIHRML